ncbi:MAG: GNAT family N-acetyltransferase [Planctomycetes bacterium]|nr:GNAT family N-acetyltransferase [Planctomycetota bacterium]
MTQLKLIPYSDDLLPRWAALHNACFNGAHNFWPVGARDLRKRIAGAPGFDPDCLLFAELGDELVGFAHGGEQGLFAVGVRPDARRAGVATALLRELQPRIGPGFDGRSLNPFWGNPRGPETSFLGMVEGIGVDEQDRAAGGFFRKAGARHAATALNLRATPAEIDLEPGRDARARAEVLGFEFAMLMSRCPQMGHDLASQRPLRGSYFTAAATHQGVVAGVAVGFATPELGPGRFGIFTLEVAKEHRRKAVGSALVMHLLLEMQSGPFTACEVTTVPSDSPGALELYERLGFQPCARFVVWE